MTSYRQHKATARYRGIEHALTEHEYDEILRGACVYCDCPSTGIDRVDAKQGYLPHNCVPACQRCNARKANFEHLGPVAAVERTMALAYRNDTPPPSKREWRMCGAYKLIT